ncbi:MAG: hypothetical protein JNJ54_30650 [Myxococcaceae bacterium]|nr:hypothetical protein [Myxococcaceae bacterium]
MSLRPFSELSRRRLLRVALGAGGLVAGGVGSVFALRGSAPRVEGLRALSPHEYRTMASLAEAMFPRETLPAGDPAVDLARAFDGYLADEPTWARDEAKQALTLLELGPVLFDRRLATFSNLALSERVAHFERWGRSDSGLRRQVATGFRKFLCLVFYDQPSAWPGLGYEGPMRP